MAVAVAAAVAQINLCIFLLFYTFFVSCSSGGSANKEKIVLFFVLK